MHHQDRIRSVARLTRAAIVLTALPLLSGTGLAQMNDAEARAEIAFAKGLAADWGFVELAEQVIGGLEDEGVSRKVGEELGLLKCEIYFIAGQNDATNRDLFFKRSLAAYEAFIEENEYSEYLTTAQAQLVSVATMYSKSLAMALETEAGEAAEELRREMTGVLDTAIAMTGKLVEEAQSVPMGDRTNAQQQELHKLLLDRGDLLLELAKIQEDGTFSFEQSFRSYETLVDEAGESSPWGLRAFVGIGDNVATQGEWLDAAGYYEYVVEMAMTRDLDAWNKAKQDGSLTLEDIDRQFLFVQLATTGLVESLAQAGKTQEAADWGLHFYNSWKREGLNLVRPLGHLALLAVARTLVDAGGYIGGSLSAGDAEWFEDRDSMQAKFKSRREQRPALDLALSMAQSVNDDNRGNTLQLHAQKVISEIISRPGVQVDPEILYEAAQGEFFDKNYPRAITSFKRVLASLGAQDEARRRELGPRTLWHIGRSFQYLERPVEAAVTYQEATGDRWRGDPEFDAKNAERYYDVMKALARGSNDPLLTRMMSEAEDRAASMSSEKGADIDVRIADDLYAKKDYDAAKAKYATVQTSAEHYERAMVFVGVCEYQLGKYDEAEQVFDKYLNEYVEAPINTTNDTRRLQRRKEATATAYFYWGLGAYKAADAAPPGEGDWQKVVDKLADFHVRFPEQTKFAPAALYRVLIAYTRLDQNPKARGVYESMLEAFPDDRWTGQASVDYYKVLKAQQAAATDPAVARKLLREMAEALQVLNATSPSPKFASMRAESRHWLDLGEWAVAEELLKRIEAKFAGTEEEDLNKFVRPDLGRALLEQRKVAEAAAVLKPLVDEQLASRTSARNYAIAVTGWIEYSEPEGGRPVIEQVPGIGGEAFGPAAELINSLVQGAESWESDWYGYKVDQIYAYLMWSEVDGKKLDTAKEMIGYMSTNLGAQFQHEKIPESMRQKYLWLASKLK